MVLSFSNSLMVATQFAWQQGKAWVRPSVHTNQGIFRTLALTEGANIINLPICQAGNCSGWPQIPLAVALGIIWNTENMLFLH